MVLRQLILVFTATFTLVWGAQAAATPNSVHVLTNDPTGNTITTYIRNANGTFESVGTLATGGTGTGGGLESQGSLILNGTGTLLFGVNAASNTISAFRVEPSHLVLIGTVNSGGERPVSLTVRGDVLYVLNEAGSGNIAGFTIGAEGLPLLVPGWTQRLSREGSGGAQIQFHPTENLLIVTERNTNRILTYRVDDRGMVLEAPRVQLSNGRFPFGFAFTPRGQLIVSEAFGGSQGLSATSSYRVHRNGGLKVVRGSAPTRQLTACWTVVTRDGAFAYVTNTASGTVSGYRVSRNAGLRLLNRDGITADAGAGSAPTEAALNPDSSLLYVTNVGSRTLVSFSIGVNGSLTPAGSIEIPRHVVGLAVR